MPRPFQGQIELDVRRSTGDWPAFLADRAIDGFTPVRSLGFGALLSGVNPKNLALTLAAAATIAQAGLDGGETAISIAVFVVIGSLTVAGPVVFYLVATRGPPDRWTRSRRSCRSTTPSS